MGKALKLAAFSCTHFPLNDPAATDWVIERVAKEKPDVIAHLGDGIEANAASQWGDAKELAIDLDAEYAAQNEFLAALRKAAPKARRIFRPGNHELNVMAAGRIDPRIRKICDWASPKNIPEWEHWQVERTYNYCRDLGCTQLGPIFLSHGFETTPGQLATQAMYFLKNWPFALLLTGHTHRPQRIAEVKWQNNLPLNRFYGDVGCLRDLRPTYMDRKRKWGWGHAMFLGEFVELKSPRMAKEWGGEVEILRLYDDRAAA
jgi:predicted phosphodiesterase